MTKRSYSQEVNDARVMLAGIKNHLAVLSQRKIDENFANDFQNMIEACITLNNEQEQLKARLKGKTAELNATIGEMKKRASEARKIIKLDIPQASWTEFGISDKR